MMRHPAGNAFVGPQGQQVRVVRKPFGSFNLQQAGGRIHQSQRTARGPHQRHRLTDNQLKRLRRFQRRVNSTRHIV